MAWAAAVVMAAITSARPVCLDGCVLGCLACFCFGACCLAGFCLGGCEGGGCEGGGLRGRGLHGGGLHGKGCSVEQGAEDVLLRHLDGGQARLLMGDGLGDLLLQHTKVGEGGCGVRLRILLEERIEERSPREALSSRSTVLLVVLLVGLLHALIACGAL